MASFLRQFWREKRNIGAMAPSSRFLAEKMLENIQFASANVLVELGPGTGVFTEKIVAEMSPTCTLLVFEVNDTFYEKLKRTITDPRVVLIHDSAERIDHYLAKYHLDKADAVISSLPLANFPSELRTSILKEANTSLKSNGKYIQFQYSLQAKKELEGYYSSITISFTPLNFPPAFVYTCEK